MSATKPFLLKGRWMFLKTVFYNEREEPAWTSVFDN